LRRIFAVTLLVLLLSVSTAFAADPLPAWNDTPTKKAIVAFVEAVTREDSPDFVPVAERIATFDNDGTLWSEQPMYFPEVFLLDRFRAIAPRHPEWRQAPALKKVLDGDSEKFPPEIHILVHAGYTTEEFAHSVKDWAAVARHPQTGRLYTEMVFQPMLELIGYLRDNGFKVYIVSGGWTDFMRPWTEKIYGIPPEQVCGSSVKTKLALRDGRPVIVYLPEVELIAEGPGKAVAISKYIGRRPIAAFGNSDGDLEMLQWTKAGSGLRFALLVRHTDAEREWAYDRSSARGRLDKALDEAEAKGWTVVDMKKDWKVVYPFEKE
jgi:hypothetical protein